MNYQRNKTRKFTKAIMTLLITFSFNLELMSMANAQTATPTESTKEAPAGAASSPTAAPIAASNFTCEDLGDQKKLVGRFVTFVEEPMGKSTTIGTTQILNCFRQTSCGPSKSNEAGGKESANPTPNKAISGAANAGGSVCSPTYVSTCKPSRTVNNEVYCQAIQAYISTTGASLLYSYIGNIYRWSAGTIGVVTVLYMVIGGIEIAASNGDSGRIEKAKERITQSIAGLALLFLSALLLYTINPNFFTL